MTAGRRVRGASLDGSHVETVRHGMMSAVPDQPLALRAVRGSLRGLAGLPPRGLRVLAGRQRVVDGQTVLPEVQIMLRLLDNAPGQAIEDLDLEAAREELDAEAWLFAGAVHVAAVRDIQVPGAAGPLDVRVYDPAPGRGKGLLVWFHPGGYCLGSLETSDAVCRHLARYSGQAVASVAYRLAPEAPFPAAVEDAVAATRYLRDHVAEVASPGGRVAVGGESSGATLAAVVAREVVEDDAPELAFQLLVTPLVDLVGRRPSHQVYGDGFGLTTRLVDWYADHYLGYLGADRGAGGGAGADVAADPRLNPLRYTSLRGVAPAHVVVAGLDPLRDEGLELADKLRADGVEVSVDDVSGFIHAAINATGLSRTARGILQRCADELRDHLAPRLTRS
ncbi:alpha/beta hydrolase [Arsenicicoccus piscis]|uniref:alpha/beta hydrolase n=1 Tax=Arsenicicoccus piscis TaxID=673954 RepID=UPI001F4D2EF8|nr:alpha/beta hydrolase [Arsenicicoccus piscis]